MFTCVRRSNILQGLYRNKMAQTVWIVREAIAQKPRGVFSTEELANAEKRRLLEFQKERGCPVSVYITRRTMDDTKEYVVKDVVSGKDVAVYTTAERAHAAANSMTVYAREAPITF